MLVCGVVWKMSLSEVLLEDPGFYVKEGVRKFEHKSWPPWL